MIYFTLNILFLTFQIESWLHFKSVHSRNRSQIIESMKLQTVKCLLWISDVWHWNIFKISNCSSFATGITLRCRHIYVHWSSFSLASSCDTWGGNNTLENFFSITPPSQTMAGAILNQLLVQKTPISEGRIDCLILFLIKRFVGRLY